MKRLMVVGTLLMGLAGCAPEDGLSEEDKMRIRIVKPWEVAYVLLNSTDITDLGYSLFRFELREDGTWTAAHSQDLFATSGEWSFGRTNGQPDLNKLILSGKEVQMIVNPEGSTLTLRFFRNGTETIGGRTAQTGGNYEIYLLPQFVPRGG